MANFGITINAGEFSVSGPTITSTACADIIEYEVQSVNGHSITIDLTGSFTSEVYILNGVETAFTNSVTVVFNNSLTVRFAIENSGSAGMFDSAQVSITDNTTTDPTNNFTESNTRADDSDKCGAGAGVTDFDSLDDTPSSKVGNALRFVRVNAAETDLEYVDLTTGDKHFEFDQTVASAQWIIAHNLDKFPSVTIVNSAGDEVVGEVTHVDNNNLTIDFNAAFSGKAYLN